MAKHLTSKQGLVLDGVGEASQLAYLSQGVDGLPSNNVNYEFSFSPDGHQVLFTSYATNLVESASLGGMTEVFLKDLVTEEIQVVSTGQAGEDFFSATTGVFHPDGQRIAFVGDGVIHVKNLATGAIEFVHSISEVSCFGPQFSPDGKQLAFMSIENTGGGQNSEGGGTGSGGSTGGGHTGGNDFLVTDLYIKNLETGELLRIPLPDGDGVMPGSVGSLSFSPDSRTIALSTAADGLYVGDTNSTWDIYSLNIESLDFTLISAGIEGGSGNNESVSPVFSPDGSKLAFSSRASDLISGLSGTAYNVFEKDLTTGSIRLLVTSGGDGLSNGYALRYKYSGDGTFGVFDSNSPDFFPDGNGGAVVQNIATGEYQLVAHELVANQPNGGNYYGALSPDGSGLVFESSGKFDESGNIIHKPGIYFYSFEAMPSRGEHLVGGRGVDAVTYASAATGVVLDLRDTDGSSNAGEALNDTFLSIESFILTDHNDQFHGLSRQKGVESVDGGEGDDRLFGHGGRDHLSGGVGDDWLAGGAQRDVLAGGIGADTFAFAKGERGRDTITDFELGVDTLRFSGVRLDQVRLVAAGDDTVVVVRGQGAVFLVEGVSDIQALWNDIAVA